MAEPAESRPDETVGNNGGGANTNNNSGDDGAANNGDGNSNQVHDNETSVKDAKTFPPGLSDLLSLFDKTSEDASEREAHIMAHLEAHPKAPIDLWPAKFRGTICDYLHVAIANQWPDTVVIGLLQAKRDAASKSYQVSELLDFNVLPLHLALLNKASDAVLMALFKAYPRAAISFKPRMIPLHHAIQIRASEALVLAVLKAYPEAARDRDVNNKTPLDLVNEHDTPSKAVVAALEELQINLAKLLLSYKNAASPGFTVLEGGRHVDVGLHNWKNNVLKEIKEHPEDLKKSMQFQYELYYESKKDCDDGLPLHYVLLNDLPEEVVMAMIKNYPGACNIPIEKDGLKVFPILMPFLASETPSETVLMELIKTCPDAVKNPYGGYFPLHFAFGLNKKVSEIVLMALLDVYPEAAGVKHEYEDSYLLQWAIQYLDEKLVSESCVRKVLNAYPKAAIEGNSISALLKARASEGLVIEMLQHCHELFDDDNVDDEELDSLFGLVEENYQLGSELKLKHALIEANVVFKLCDTSHDNYDDYTRPWLEQLEPGRLSQCDSKGRLFLHLAAQFNASERVVALLLEKNPKAVTVGDSNGSLPLHIAVKTKASIKVIERLIKAHPETVRQKDNTGKLPLDVLLEEYSKTNREDITKVKQKYLEVVLLALLKADMPIRNGDPIEHGYSWTTCVASPIGIAENAVSQILAPNTDTTGGCDFGKYIHKLSNVLDTEGRTALEISSQNSREEIYKYLLFCGRYELSTHAPEHVSATSILLRAQDHSEFADYGAIFQKADKDNSGTLDAGELQDLAWHIGLEPEIFLNQMTTNIDEDHSVSKEVFIAECKRLLGDGPRKVVLKFMQSEEHWERERDARTTKRRMDPKYVLLLFKDVPDTDAIGKAVESGSGGLDAIVNNHSLTKPGKHVVVMDAADRNLHQIFYQERPQGGVMRGLLKQLFEAVAHLHDRKLMHGDLKMLNVVRLGRDNRLRLIDFDAAAMITRPGDKESYAGAKFSSATLPPEMFFELTTEDECKLLEEYWVESKMDEEICAKVAPKKFNRKQNGEKWYVVKSFYTRGGEAVNDGRLPYELVKASDKIDVWALGVLTFALLSGETLIPANRDDDCTSGAAMEVLYNWGNQEDVMKERFGRISDPRARNLLQKMLHPDPNERPAVDDLLKESYFTDNSSVTEEELQKINEHLEDITANQVCLSRVVMINQKLIGENKEELLKSRKILLKGIFEATEVKMPTTFIVLPERLPSPPTKKEKKLLEVANDCSGFKLSGGVISVSVTTDGAKIDPEGKLKKHVKALNTGMKWINCIKDLVASDLSDKNVDNAFTLIKNGLSSLMTAKTMYLYLVDELTGEPVRAAGWPIEITEPSEHVHKLLPMMQVGIRAMSIYNGSAGIARMCGFPIPTVPEVWSKGARESVDILKQKSSVENFGPVQQVLESDMKESKSLRGASLREFMNFLNAHDPGLKADRQGDFAGLQRIGDTNSGTAVWTALSDPDKIKDAIEERSVVSTLFESSSSHSLAVGDASNAAHTQPPDNTAGPAPTIRGTVGPAPAMKGAAGPGAAGPVAATEGAAAILASASPAVKGAIGPTPATEGAAAILASASPAVKDQLRHAVPSMPTHNSAYPPNVLADALGLAKGAVEAANKAMDIVAEKERKEKYECQCVIQ